MGNSRISNEDSCVICLSPITHENPGVNLYANDKGRSLICTKVGECAEAFISQFQPSQRCSICKIPLDKQKTQASLQEVRKYTDLITKFQGLSQQTSIVQSNNDTEATSSQASTFQGLQTPPINTKLAGNLAIRNDSQLSNLGNKILYMHCMFVSLSTELITYANSQPDENSRDILKVFIKIGEGLTALQKYCNSSTNPS